MRGLRLRRGSWWPAWLSWLDQQSHRTNPAARTGRSGWRIPAARRCAGQICPRALDQLWKEAPGDAPAFVIVQGRASFTDKIQPMVSRSRRRTRHGGAGLRWRGVASDDLQRATQIATEKVTRSKPQLSKGVADGPPRPGCRAAVAKRLCADSLLLRWLSRSDDASLSNRSDRGRLSLAAVYLGYVGRQLAQCLARRRLGADVNERVVASAEVGVRLWCDGGAASARARETWR